MCVCVRACVRACVCVKERGSSTPPKTLITILNYQSTKVQLLLSLLLLLLSSLLLSLSLLLSSVL